MNSESFEREMEKLAKEEYDRQISDLTTIQHRSSFIIVLYVGILTMIVTDFQRLPETVLWKLCFSFLMIIAILLVLGFVMLVLVNYPSSMIKIKSADFNNDANKSKSDFIRSKRASYQYYIDENSKVLKRKILYFNIACWATVASFVLSILTTIIIFCE